MPLYDYECETCGATKKVWLPFAAFDKPVWCDEGIQTSGRGHRTQMTRLFTARFQIIACLERDKDENRLYLQEAGISERDQAAMFKEDMDYHDAKDAEAARKRVVPKYQTTDDIMATGLAQACQSWEGLAQWKEEHISKDDSLPVTSVEEEAATA